MQDSHIVDSQQALSFRHLVLLAAIVGSLLLVLMLPPVVQDNGYHLFADKRMFFGVPAFLNVASNLGFLVFGVVGVLLCLVKPPGSFRVPWATVFTGISFIAFGSAYYHIEPGPWSLVWDRLPMTVGFIGLFVALLGEYVDARLGILLGPALLIGFASVIYWYLTGDLRLYIWVQGLPLITIPVLLFLFPPKYSHQWLLAVSLGFYVLAKAAEFYDLGIFHASGQTVSGHTAKHLISSAGCGAIALMLYKRERLSSEVDPLDG